MGQLFGGYLSLKLLTMDVLCAERDLCQAIVSHGGDYLVRLNECEGSRKGPGASTDNREDGSSEVARVNCRYVMLRPTLLAGSVWMPGSLPSAASDRRRFCGLSCAYRGMPRSEFGLGSLGCCIPGIGQRPCVFAGPVASGAAPPPFYEVSGSLPCHIRAWLRVVPLGSWWESGVS